MWKGYPEVDNTWEPADQIHAPQLINAYHRQYPLTDKRGRTVTKKVIRFLSNIPSCQPMDLTTPAMNPPCRPGLLLLRNPQGKKGHKSSERRTPSSLTKKYRGYWGQTDCNSASWPRYKEEPYPPGRHKTSPKGRTSTPQYSKALSTQWRKLPDEWRADTPLKRGSSKKPSTTSNKQGFQPNGSTQNDHSKKPHLATKKTEEKSTSAYLAKTGTVVLLNGSSKWTEEKWPDTPRTMRPGTSPSSLTFTPPKNTTTMP